MGTGYTRNDTVNNIADGNVINASDLDGEFDAVQAAFNESTGHTHDGTSAEGAPVTTVGPAQDVNVGTGAVTPKTDNTIDLGSGSLEFKDLYIDGTANIDALVADTADINAGTIDGTIIGGSTPAAATVTTLAVNGNTTLGDAATDTVTFTADVASNVIPSADNTYDLGASGSEWKDLYIDGTANIDSLVADTADINGGTIDGVTIGGAAPGVGTFTTANATTVDATNIEVTNIKAKDGSASATIADSTGVMTIASSVLTTADINGGTIDNATIATSNITVGAGKTLDVSAGTLTLANDQISGDKVQGGTIGSTTITTLTSTTGNITTVNATTVDTTNIEVTNIKAKDGTSAGSIADSTGVVTLASSVLTTTDINGGTIDGTAIGGSTPAAGSFTTLNTSGQVVFNDAGADVDFRVEGDTDANLLFVDASTDRVGIGTSSPAKALTVFSSSSGNNARLHNVNFTSLEIMSDRVTPTQNIGAISFLDSTAATASQIIGQVGGVLAFENGGTERMRIDSSGNLLVGTTTTSWTDTVGIYGFYQSALNVTRSGAELMNLNRLSNDGNLLQFWQAGVQEGAISVSGNTITYGAFTGGHWAQLTEGRGYNPDIPRGTVMSTIGEMCEWKSVEWTETTEHPAIPAVEAKEAVLDEEGNVIEPAVEAIEGKDAWTETFNKRESYLGDLPVGATFEEDGFTKTVVDDGNERLPKVKISDVVGDKAVYGVFQTWDEVEDMMVVSLGAFVVRIAAGVTVEIGDLLESNGDGCAKVQDDDVIRSKTIAKVTSTTPTATYDDGSYTVPAVIYCG